MMYNPYVGRQVYASRYKLPTLTKQSWFTQRSKTNEINNNQHSYSVFSKNTYKSYKVQYFDMIVDHEFKSSFCYILIKQLKQ